MMKVNSLLYNALERKYPQDVTKLQTLMTALDMQFSQIKDPVSFSRGEEKVIIYDGQKDVRLSADELVKWISDFKFSDGFDPEFMGSYNIREQCSNKFHELNEKNPTMPLYLRVRNKMRGNRSRGLATLIDIYAEYTQHNATEPDDCLINCIAWLYDTTDSAEEKAQLKAHANNQLHHASSDEQMYVAQKGFFNMTNGEISSRMQSAYKAINPQERTAVEIIKEQSFIRSELTNFCKKHPEIQCANFLKDHKRSLNIFFTDSRDLSPEEKKENQSKYVEEVFATLEAINDLTTFDVSESEKNGKTKNKGLV